MKKHILCILLIACMMVGLLPTAALADDNVPYLDENGTEQICANATEVTKDIIDWGTKGTTTWYVARGEVTIDSRVIVTGDVRLILADGCALTVNNGIRVQDNGNALTIYGQTQPVLDADGKVTNNVGTLTARNNTESTGGAAIGSLVGHNAGTITINGGVITANGVECGAGIGGSLQGTGGVITINGGAVTATGGNYAAGIGGGHRSDNGGVITINGGTITANGGTYAAGIGGGSSQNGDVNKGNGGVININGGTVTANGGFYGAGIGGGWNAGDNCGNGGTITISGGTVTATGGNSAAGIGGGRKGGSGTFQTREEGRAVIFASSIGDTSNQSNWSGIIFTGNSGKVYGTSVAPIENFTVESGKTLTIDEGKSLTILSGVTMTVNGTVTNNGTISVSGTLTGSGSISPKVSQPDTPPGPTVLSVTADSITLKTMSGGVNGVEYSKDGKNWQSEPTFSGLEAATSYSFSARYAGNNLYAPSDTQTLTGAYTAYAAPGVGVGYSINFDAETITVTDGYEANTKSDFDSSTAVTSGSTVTPGRTLYVRKATSGEIPASEGTEFTLPDRPLAPALRIDNGTESVTIPGGYCYNTTGSGLYTDTGWTDGSDNAVTVEPGTSIYIYKAATASAFKSEVQTLTAPSRSSITAPTIDCTAETLSTDTTMEYSINGGTIWTDCTANMKATAFGWTGSAAVTVQFRTKATDSHYAGEAQSVTIPARPDTPSPAGVNETIDGKHDGRITGVDNTMEYRKVVDGNWTACAGTTVTDLAPGTYQVRVKATDTDFASLAADVTIATGAEKTYTLNVTAPTFDAATYGYTRPAAQAITITSSGNWQSAISNVTVDSTDFTIGGSGSTVTAGGSIDTWTVQPAAGLAAGSHTATITVTYNDGATATALVSFTVAKAAQTTPGAPTIKSKTWNSVTLETVPDNANGAKAQYSKDGGTTWQNSPEFRELNPDTTYTFAARYAETSNYNASDCASVEVTTDSIPTYPPTVEQPKDGTVTVSPANPALGSKVTVTVTPDTDYAVDQVIVTDKNGNPVEVKDNGDATYSFTQPQGNVTINVLFKDVTVVPFVDVPADAYYYNAVQWAVRNGITNGTSETTFSPNAPCTRGQVVTFLWRAAGCPTPNGSEMPFTDVVKGSYYETAVLWAVENGITNGTSETTFSPNAPCTRAQTVTFLWRSQGKPAAGTANPFTDVAKDTYYTDAVLWAVENGITEGTSETTFSPDEDCTRAQTVTFLYRCLSGK